MAHFYPGLLCINALRPGADPEGLPMEHFNKLQSGINVRDGEWLGEMGVPFRTVG
jgi:hypothetical protein